MRTPFHGELEQLGAQLVTMCAPAGEAMRRATQALLECDLTGAEQVISADEHLDQLRARCERHACALLALQAPVAQGLRLVLSAIQIADKIERMGALASHIADTARRRHPQCAVPTPLRDRFAELGRLATLAAHRVRQIIAAPVEEHFAEHERGDDQIDTLHREIVKSLRRPDGTYTVREGIDGALLARFFERFSDQTVSITRRLDYVVTGEVPGRSD